MLLIDLALSGSSAAEPVGILDVRATRASTKRPRSLRHVALLQGAPYDVVIDYGGARPSPVRRMTRLSLYLAPGGQVAVKVPASMQEGQGQRQTEEAEHHSAASGTRRNRRDPQGPTLSNVRLEGGFLIGQAGTAALAVVSEEQLDRLLQRMPASDPRHGHVVAQLPGLTRESRCQVRSNLPERQAALPTSIGLSSVCLREFHSVRVRPHQVAFVPGLMLPASFRGSTSKRLRNPALVRLTPRFVAEPDMSDAPELWGPHYYLDNVARGHFGHAMTEQVSQLWAWDHARARHPDLRLLVGDMTGTGLHPWELELLATHGIDEEDIELITGPAVVETLLTAAPMYRLPDQVHPAIVDTWSRIGSELARRATPAPRPQRLFLTRRGHRRQCLNVDAVEALFGQHGFHVVVPEQHSLPDQVAMVQGAEVIAGFAGSGLFNIALAASPRHVITIGPESYLAKNEYMMSAVLGHRLDMLLCRPRTPRKDGFTRESFQSDYEFDFAASREGGFLTGILEGLP